MERKHSSRPWIARLQGEGFWTDVKWALSVLAGAALGALVFDAWELFGGSVIGVVLVVTARALRRVMRRR